MFSFRTSLAIKKNKSLTKSKIALILVWGNKNAWNNPTSGIIPGGVSFVLGIDFWLEALFLFRPIIVCTLTGAILGDIQTGLITGGLTELAFAGLTPAGGVQPPNPIMAGLMTTVIAWSTGVDAKTAIGLGLPFSLLMQ